MARKIELDLQINGTGEAIKDFEKLDKNIDKVDDSLSKPIGDKTFDGLKKDLDDIANSKVEKFITNLDGSIKTLTGVVGIAAGAMGAFGIENEKVQETLLKVQSAIAFTTGVKDLSEGFKQLGLTQKLYNTITQLTTTTMGKLKLALASTGIGALIVGLGLLIANWDEVKLAVESFIEVSWKPLSEGFENFTNYLKDTALYYFRQPKEILNDLGDFIVGQFTNRVKALQNIFSGLGDAFNSVLAGDFGAAKEALSEVGSNFVDFQTGVQGTIDKVKGSFNSFVDNVGNIVNATTELYKKKKEEQDKDLEEVQRVNQETINITTKTQDEILQNTSNFSDKMQEYVIEGLSIPEQTFSKWDLFKEKVIILGEDIRNTYLGLGEGIMMIEGPLNGIGNLIGGLTSNFSNFQDAIINFTSAEGRDKVVAGLQATVAAFEILGGAIDQITQLSAEKTEERISQIERETDVKSRELQKQFNDGVITETELANAQFKLENQKFKEIEKQRKKEFEKQKKLRIISATIDMIQGAVTAFASAFQLGPIAGPIVGGILAATVTAFGLANIAKIKKEKYEGGESPTPPRITPPSPPSLSSSGGDISRSNNQNTGIDTLSTQLFGVNTGAIGGSQNIEGMSNKGFERGMINQRVYVVESDITNVQNRVNVIESDSTIG